MARMAPLLIAASCVLMPSPSLAQQWVHCALQRETCDLNGLGIVRYGVDERWYYQVGMDSISCNDPSPFGDPAPGTPKSCQRWEAPDETARVQEMEALRAQLQQQVQASRQQQEHTAELEEEVAALRRLIRERGRGERRERREPRGEVFGPTFQFGR